MMNITPGNQGEAGKRPTKTNHLIQLKANTVLESSLPDSMMRKQRGIISVVNKKFITSCSSVFTRAPKNRQKNFRF